MSVIDDHYWAPKGGWHEQAPHSACIWCGQPKREHAKHLPPLTPREKLFPIMFWGHAIERSPQPSDRGINLLTRGVVRAVFWHDKLGLSLMVEHEKYAGVYADIAGQLACSAVTDCVIREVVHCERCCSWKHPSETRQEGLVPAPDGSDGLVPGRACKEHEAL